MKIMENLNIMERINWVEHKGKKILIIDYSGLKAPKDDEIYMATLKKAYEYVSDSSEKIRFITNVTDADANKERIAKLKAFAKFCKDNDKIKKECVVGITGIKKVLLKAINTFARTNVVIIKTVEEGKEWLVSE